MTTQLKILAAVIGVTLFLYIIELVRKKRLREEYAWFWMLTGLMIVVLSLWYSLLVFIGRLLGGILPSALLFFFGLLSLLLICLHLSIKLSTLTDQVKRLSQELALMRVNRGNP
ncbi:MAG: DUF2304 domain-containing protein [Nitrospirae bacterium]|nr:DUF2304 domain-containing protein [Nitrospirota bacterium]